MCRQLTIIAESLPITKIGAVDTTGIHNKDAHKHADREYVSLTKERNPVSNKSCQFTEQAEREEVRAEAEEG